MEDLRYRIIGLLVVAIVYAFMTYPIQSIVISVVCIICYLLFVFYNRKDRTDRGRKNRRMAALKTASAFIRYNNPDDIWHNLRLSNGYCYMIMVDEITIMGIEKVQEGQRYRSFKVVSTKVHPWEEIWNMFCINFNHNKSYDGLIEDCKRYQLIIEEKIVEMPQKNTFVKRTPNTQKNENKENFPFKDDLVDINNAEEDELAALPGINIIMAKKAIKKREEIGGFKCIRDFFLFLHLKQHMQDRLINRICVKEIKITGNIKKSNERQVDL